MSLRVGSRISEMVYVCVWGGGGVQICVKYLISVHSNA